MIYEFESKRPKIDPSAYISDSAIVIGDVTIGARCYVGPGAVIRGDERPIYIGDESAVEDLCVIHVGGPDAKTDGCHIGKRVTIGHGANGPRELYTRRRKYRHGSHSQSFR